MYKTIFFLSCGKLEIDTINRPRSSFLRRRSRLKYLPGCQYQIIVLSPDLHENTEFLEVGEIKIARFYVTQSHEEWNLSMDSHRNVGNKAFQFEFVCSYRCICPPGWSFYEELAICVDERKELCYDDWAGGRCHRARPLHLSRPECCCSDGTD